MTKKERKNLAKKIAKAEYVIQNSDDEEAIHKAQLEVMTLSGTVDSLEDIVAVDEYVQDILADMT